MYFFFEFFNEPRPYIDPDHSKWPAEWKKVEFKTYPRLPQIKLPEPKLPEASLEEAILKRKSGRDFSGKPLSQEELSSLLFLGAGLTHKNENPDRTRRAYPSGGARYPIEIYLALYRVRDLKPGLYHYNVKEHTLELLLEGETEKLDDAFHYDFVRNAAVVFMFSMIPERSTIKYGNFGLKIGLIEAGHLAENIYLVSAALGLKCCSLGGLNEKLISGLLELDNSEEILFYALAAGG